MAQGTSMLKILLVDDDDIDILALKRAFGKHPVMKKANLSVAKNGKEALATLTNEDSTLPDLVMLDLNMPGMNGLQFLETVRNNKCLEKLRIVVLTTSSDPTDIKEASDKCIVGYIPKSKAGNYKEITDLVYLYCKLTENT